MTARALLLSLASLLLAAGLGCTTEQPQPPDQDPPYGQHDDLERLIVTPTFINFGTDDRTPLEARARYASGAEVDVTSQVTWFVLDEAVATVEGNEAVGVGVGATQVYATLADLTSNLATVEVGHFTYTVECWSDPSTPAKQAELVECSVDVDGRELDEDHPEYVTFEIEGFIPFGHDRASQGLPTTNYFWVEDENTFKALFLIPPSLPVGEHDVTFEVEGVPGEGDGTVGVSESSLPEKTCSILQSQGILGAYNERKFRVLFDHSPRAHLITSEAGVGSQLDTALWLFDDQGNLFTWTDNPRTGGTDAVLPVGITQDLEGEYFVTLTASPYAESSTTELGAFVLGCEEETVDADPIPGDTEVAIPNGEQPTDLTLEVSLGVNDLIDDAWVHVDLETDFPDQVSITLAHPNPAYSIGLRSTGYDADRLAITWDDDLVPPDAGHLSNFTNLTPNGSWTLTVTDFSTSGTTVVHGWELYLATSTP